METELNNSSKISENQTPSPEKTTPISSSSPNPDALALSFSLNEEPVPLVVCYPGRRRSSRFSTNKFSTSELMKKNRKCISPEKEVLLPSALAGKKTPAESTRRSPRLVSPSATGKVKGKGKNVNSRKQVESSRKRKYKNNDDEPENPKTDGKKRRSDSVSAKLELLALPEADGAWGTRCGTKRELLALLTPEGSKNSKRGSRGSDSGNVGHDSRGSRRKNLVLAASPGTSEKKSDVVNSVGEKSLRSRRIQGSVDNEESDTKRKMNSSDSAEESGRKQKSNVFFIGEPIDAEEAQEKWQWRYELKSQNTQRKGWKLNSGEEDEIILNVECHYAQAKVAGFVFNIGDCAFVKGEGKKKHIGRILEFFKTTEGEDYFRVQWYFRAEDTVLKGAASFHDPKRIFYSTLENDNLLDCIVSKVNVIELPTAHALNKKDVPPAHFYYDMEYCVDYSTFRTLHNVKSSISPSLVDASYKPITTYPLEVSPSCEPMKVELSLLDLYAGCGGMSTGLCLGTKLSGVNLVTKWAVDFNKSACDSLKLNHPQTHVRNEGVENFLELLKRWEKLIELYGCSDIKTSSNDAVDDRDEGEINGDSLAGSDASSGEYEVLRLVDICYGDPNNDEKSGLHLDTGEKGSKMEKDYNMGMCSEEDETELELGLGLSLNSGGGGGGGVGGKTKKSPWGEYGRILTAKDFPNGFSAKRSINGGGVSGTKRAADFAGSTTEVGSPPTGASQVVGWPPIRAYRMNSLVNQSKVLNTDEDKGVGGNDKKEHSKKKINHGNSKDDAASVKEKGHLGFVKVNMDGLPIGRKVDLNAHTCYESLAETLEDMFFKSTKSGEKEQATKSFKLLDGSSEFVLTYEDKEGDWMLVGDVPFRMFLNTVKRLRIMRTSEANGLAPRIPQKQERHNGKPI